MDTGSTVTYVPCLNCTHCGQHQVRISVSDYVVIKLKINFQDAPFVPSASTSFRSIRCRSNECFKQECDELQRCTYQRHYAEKSSSLGLVVSDFVDFGNQSTVARTRVKFGCEMRETGDLYTQRADGIIGLGRGPLSLVDQLVAQKSIENVFSLCYGGMDDEGGTMVLGKIDPPGEMKFTPMDAARL